MEQVKKRPCPLSIWQAPRPHSFPALQYRQANLMLYARMVGESAREKYCRKEGAAEFLKSLMPSSDWQIRLSVNQLHPMLYLKLQIDS